MRETAVAAILDFTKTNASLPSTMVTQMNGMTF